MIYTCAGYGLGDCWAGIMWSIDLALRTSMPTSLSVLRMGGKHCGASERKYEEIIPLVKGGNLVRLTHEEPGAEKNWRDVYQAPYQPTFIRPAEKRDRAVAYQFDGKSHKEKLCPNDEAMLILRTLEEKGYELVRLGDQGDLKENLERASRCEFFVGVDSGFAHLMLSLGVDVHMIRNGRTVANIREETYPDKEFALYENAETLVKEKLCEL